MSTPTLAQQKVAVARAIEILKEVSPARVAQKKVMEEGVKLHLTWLEAALETIDGLDNGRDMRPNLLSIDQWLGAA